MDGRGWNPLVHARIPISRSRPFSRTFQKLVRLNILFASVCFLGCRSLRICVRGCRSTGVLCMPCIVFLTAIRAFARFSWQSLHVHDKSCEMAARVHSPFHVDVSIGLDY